MESRKNTTPNPTSSTALALQTLRPRPQASQQRPWIELTSHSVRVGSMVWDTNTFLRNFKSNMTYALTLLLLLEKAQAYGPPSVKADFYTSDPTGQTNYRYVSYSRDSEMKDVPDDIINNCHPNVTSTIVAAAYSTIATVGDITAFIARGVDQATQSEFERCIIEQMQTAYDDAQASAELFLQILLPVFFGAPLALVTVILCLALSGCALYFGTRAGIRHCKDKHDTESPANAAVNSLSNDSDEEVELDDLTFPEKSGQEKEADLEEAKENPDEEEKADNTEKNRDAIERNPDDADSEAELKQDPAYHSPSMGRGK